MNLVITFPGMEIREVLMQYVSLKDVIKLVYTNLAILDFPLKCCQGNTRTLTRTAGVYTCSCADVFTCWEYNYSLYSQKPGPNWPRACLSFNEKLGWQFASACVCKTGQKSHFSIFHMYLRDYREPETIKLREKFPYMFMLECHLNNTYRCEVCYNRCIEYEKTHNKH